MADVVLSCNDIGHVLPVADTEVKNKKTVVGSPESILFKTESKAIQKQNISANFDYPDLNIKKSSKHVVSSSVRHEINLKKVKKAREGLVKKEQNFFERVWSFISSPFKSDNYEEIDVLLAQLLDEIYDKSDVEKQDLIKDFYTNSRICIDLPETQEEFEKYTRYKKLNSKSVSKISEKFSNSRSFTRKLALAVMNGNKDKQFIVNGALEDVVVAENNLKELVFEYLPEDITQAQAQEVFEALATYSKMQAVDILKSLQNGEFKQKFIDEVRKKADDIIKATGLRIKEYIKEFFETAKGRTVKRAVKNAYEKTQFAKKEFFERKEITKTATQKAQEAKKQNEKAIAEAKEEEEKSRSLAQKFGHNNLDKDKLYDLVKLQSPLLANNFLYAQEKEKKAYWSEYDANVAKEHAEFLEKMALNRFEFESMKMEAMFAKMQALMNTQFV